MDTARHPEFAFKLRSARLRSGKSQERIAAEVGTSRRHWIRWENGDHLPSPEFMERIGVATGQPAAFAAESSDDDEEAAPMPSSLLEVLYVQLGAALGKKKTSA